MTVLGAGADAMVRVMAAASIHAGTKPVEADARSTAQEDAPMNAQAVITHVRAAAAAQRIMYRPGHYCNFKEENHHEICYAHTLHSGSVCRRG